MAVYEIKQFSGGISDYEDRGITGSFKFGANLDIRRTVDSLTCNQALIDEGIYDGRSPSASVSPSLSISSSPSLSPSPSISPTPSPSSSVSASPSTTPSSSVSLSPSVSASSSVSLSPSPSAGSTSVFRDLIRFFVKCSDGYTYGFGSTGYVYRRDRDAFWQTVYKDPDGEIKGAEEKPSSNGKTYLYLATATKLKRKEIPGNSSWNDVTVVAQNLSSDYSHTMKQIGGALMIANGSKLAFVGYDNSYTNESVNLIPGNVAKTIVERNGRAIIGTYKAADPDSGINAAIDSEVPLAQVGNDGYVYYSNMSDSIPVKRFPGGGKCNPGGVANEIEEINFFEWEQDALSWIDKQTVGNLALFAVYDADSGKGGIYSLGRKNKNKPFVMNLEYQLDADELGALAVVDSTILVSYQDGSTFGVKAVDSTTKAEGIYEGLDLKAPVKKPVNITRWNVAELLLSPLPDGTSVSFYYKMNKTGDWVRARTADGETSFSTASGKKAVFSIQSEGEIIEPRVVLTPSFNVCPEVHRIRIYFN
jgi:hypothetical protein